MTKVIIGILLFLYSNTICLAQVSTYVPKDSSFIINYPETWTVIDNETFPMIAFGAIAPRENDSDAFSENINLIIEGKGSGKMSLENYKETSIKMSKPFLPNFKFISESYDTTDDKSVALKFYYTHSPNDVKLKVLSYLGSTGNRLFTITCSAKEEEFDKYYETFLVICRSISFQKIN